MIICCLSIKIAQSVELNVNNYCNKIAKQGEEATTIIREAKFYVKLCL